MVYEKFNPYENGNFPNFIDKAISCALLRGDYYEVDCHTFHRSLLSFTTWKPSEDCIKSTLRYKYEKISMKLFSDHFDGEDYTTRNIYKLYKLCNYLHYKNGSSMEFELFNTKCHKMYRIFEEEGKSM